MTKMLASVMSATEVSIALEKGVDIIDLKEPGAGALGALAPATVTKIIDIIQGAVLTSATIGDVSPDHKQLFNLMSNMADTGVDIVKVGLFAETPTDYFIDSINKAVTNNIQLVVVLFAENYIGIESFKPLLDTGIRGLMLDTKNKSGNPLGSLLKKQCLGHFINEVQSHGLLSGLAGSLRFEDIDDLLPLRPDYLGFRGALCSENNRTCGLDPFKVKKIRDQIPVQNIMNYADSNSKKQKRGIKNGTVA